MIDSQFDIAVIGSGMAGLTCAQQLRKAGYQVIILEKSRGVGGRVATRRMDDYRIDHGARFLEPVGPQVQGLIEALQQQQLLQQWTDQHYEFRSNQLQALPNPLPRYVPENGMNTVGQFLADGLEIWFNRRVQTLQSIESTTWHLGLEQTHETAKDKPLEVRAKLVIFAIPAPQALALLEPLTDQLSANLLEQIRSVTYHPSMTVMAGYSSLPKPPWKGVNFIDHDSLEWVSLESSKRPQPPVVVIQSHADFAQTHLETTDLETPGKQLIQAAATSLMAELNQPDWFKVHRWRYAFCSQPLAIPCLTETIPLPLVCIGDWCGGNQIEGALTSGKAGAEWVKNHIGSR